MNDDSQQPSQAERQQRLADELDRLQELHRASEGNRVLGRMRVFGTSYQVFLGNHADLRGFLDHIAAPMVNVQMWNERYRYRLDYALDQVARLLHNYVSAVISLVEATRRFVKTHYAGTQLFKEYERRVKSDFADAPLHRFLQDLRNYSLHYRLPAMTAVTSLRTREDGGVDIDNAFKLDVNTLEEWDGWKVKAREYLETLGSEADLRNIIDDYEPVVTGFQGWLSERIAEEHSEAVRDLYDLEARMKQVERDWRISRGDSQVLQEETPHESSREPLVETSSKSDTSDFATIDDLIATFYESTSFPLGGVPNLDRFRSLFVSNAQLVKVETDKSYQWTLDGYIGDFYAALSEGSTLAESEMEVGRSINKYGKIAHVVSTSTLHSVESGRTRRARGFHSLHLVEDGGRWFITSMLWGTIEVATDPVAADPASEVEDDAASEARAMAAGGACNPRTEEKREENHDRGAGNENSGDQKT